MGGRVVQLVQGRTKALEGKSPEEMLASFAGFPQIQVIDLDAALGTGSNDGIVHDLTVRTAVRVGGGIRSIERAKQLVNYGAFRVILGTSVFSSSGPDRAFLSAAAESVGAERLTVALDTRAGRVLIKGWQESTPWSALDLIPELEPYCSGFLCTHVDKEGLMQGTDLAWFESLRSKTKHELVAAGGITTLDEIRALTSMHIHCAIGMAIYTGRLKLEHLRFINAANSNY